MTLASERLGVVAKLDRVEHRDGITVPVETKHGTPARGSSPVRAPELAQLTVQALLLREQGHNVPFAEVFFADAQSRKRVELPPDSEQWVRRLVAEIRENVASGAPPPALVDSPKCPRCSLVGVCLPDETNLLAHHTDTPPRRLVASDAPTEPLYVMSPSAIVRKRGERLVVEIDGEESGSRRLIDVSHVAVFGNATLTAAALRACLERDAPILWFTLGGWFSAITLTNGGSWVARRMAQILCACDAASIGIARSFIAGKIRNQRTLLRRNLGPEVDDRTVLGQLAGLATRADHASSSAELLGIEGTAARLYFEWFPRLLNPDVGQAFNMTARNRRPPTDPINAMLSFVYALLVRDTTVAALASGLDPQVGVLHQPRFGRPSLALDLAEEFRPLIADSTVITAVNNGELGERDFVRRGGAVALTASARKRLVKTYERRVHVTLRHPVFGYDVSYRRAMELQARQLAAMFDGQLATYRPLTTR